MIWILEYRPAFGSAYNYAPTNLVAAKLKCTWVTPDGMSRENIIADFERRHFGTRVVSLEPKEVAA